jgi:hypothetical protein
MGVFAVLVRVVTALALAGATSVRHSSDDHPGEPAQVWFVGSQARGTATALAGATSFVSGLRLGRAAQAVVVTCTQRLEHPHWSRTGDTVVFKTRITCVGNKPTVRVRITTLMGRVVKKGMVLVAGTRESRTILVDGQPSDPVYTPGTDARKVRIDGRYRGESTLEIIEPGGVKSGPISKQTPIFQVDAR